MLRNSSVPVAAAVAAVLAGPALAQTIPAQPAQAQGQSVGVIKPEDRPAARAAEKAVADKAAEPAETHPRTAKSASEKMKDWAKRKIETNVGAAREHYGNARDRMKAWRAKQCADNGRFCPKTPAPK